MVLSLKLLQELYLNIKSFLRCALPIRAVFLENEKSFRAVTDTTSKFVR